MAVVHEDEMKIPRRCSVPPPRNKSSFNHPARAGESIRKVEWPCLPTSVRPFTLEASLKSYAVARRTASCGGMFGSGP